MGKYNDVLHTLINIVKENTKYPVDDLVLDVINGIVSEDIGFCNKCEKYTLLNKHKLCQNCGVLREKLEDLC